MTVLDPVKTTSLPESRDRLVGAAPPPRSIGPRAGLLQSLFDAEATLQERRPRRDQSARGGPPTKPIRCRDHLVGAAPPPRSIGPRRASCKAYSMPGPPCRSGAPAAIHRPEAVLLQSLFDAETAL